MDVSALSIWQIWQAGGPMMWPLAVISIAGAALIIERLWFLKQLRIDLVQFQGLLFDRIKHHRIKEAVQLCDGAHHPIANVLKAAIVKYDRPRSQVKEAMEDAALYELPKLHKNLAALQTLANVAPLLGFLGTVLGFVRVFGVIRAHSAAALPVTATDISAGVMEALLATAAGLMIAVPVFIAYNFLVSRVNAFILEMEQSATELVNFLSE
ncbi:MAG: MotA/TolQ/ExbB proton channel family protein [Candidatus Omnitrophica bacterium]|nr:MotA/TolQ/ExbB proton channel family protein [Candidatus Omnitrophota bacterium]MDD4941180.1 MotA/TolQ/ExbB proton channel family protein [Candidatus Omnitrophota bacterium]MDD5774852.1 MotA/TolQ/ExbB proton channel family protein [Candidatus Omnitrophota bacterium]HNQ50648.1 MotA/TolQ/ExbB proton channel family protein [Candidatus Omnitrophota bacterium]HQO37646.1 MotA/TolQ/ExbB proton channel family protein [Candidatus Omnitrophota bacterium]